MPSSSERSTRLERHLLDLFKHASYRLSKANAHQENAFLYQQFACLLDLSVSDLLATLKPRFTGNNLKAYNEDTQFWKELKAEVTSKKESAIVYEAGRVLAHVGTALFNVGRDAEAKEWCGWGDTLEALSCNILNEEERFARANGFE